MAINATIQPVWYSLSHHGRFRRLHKVRRIWCRYHYSKHEDSSDRTLHMDGRWINDVPSFHLSLGEAVNGPNGYFGGCLNALSDCLCGGFGVVPPLTIRLSHFNEVREALDGRAWCHFEAEYFQRAVRDGESTEQMIDWGLLGDGSEADIARWTAIYEAALTGEPFDCNGFRSCFDALLEVFHKGGTVLISEEGGGHRVTR